MFNTYSYKTVPLAGIQRNQIYQKKKIKIIQEKKLMKMKFLQLFYFYFIYDCACMHLFSVF